MKTRVTYNLKPRDPFVQHLVKKKQGAHFVPTKTLRMKDKIKLQKTLKGYDND